MTLEEEARLSCYQKIGVLNEAHEVFLVQHTVNHQVFVKKTLSHYDRQVFESLKQDHVPGTPYLYDLIEDQGRLIVIEEYISGQPLSELLLEQGHLPEGQAVYILRELCVTLQYLHQMTPPVVHRDIKPSNIILKEDGRPVLLDMDAARGVRPEKPADTELIGTVGFAAPEQYGFAASDARTDLYACGVLLNVMLTGKMPKETLASGRLGAIIAKCTQMDPSQRYASAAELLNALTEGLSIQPVTEEKDLNQLPGFRTSNLFTRYMAAAGYLIVALLSLSLKVDKDGVPASLPVLWCNRIICFLLFLSLILFSGNYRGIWQKLGITRIYPRWLRILAVLLIDLLILFLWMLLLYVLESWIA